MKSHLENITAELKSMSKKLKTGETVDVPITASINQPTVADTVKITAPTTTTLSSTTIEKADDSDDDVPLIIDEIAVKKQTDQIKKTIAEETTSSVTSNDGITRYTHPFKFPDRLEKKGGPSMRLRPRSIIPTQPIPSTSAQSQNQPLPEDFFEQIKVPVTFFIDVNGKTITKKGTWGLHVKKSVIAVSYELLKKPFVVGPVGPSNIYLDVKPRLAMNPLIPYDSSKLEICCKSEFVHPRSYQMNKFTEKMDLPKPKIFMSKNELVKVPNGIIHLPNLRTFNAKLQVWTFSEENTGSFLPSWKPLKAEGYKIEGPFVHFEGPTHQGKSHFIAYITDGFVRGPFSECFVFNHSA